MYIVRLQLSTNEAGCTVAAMADEAIPLQHVNTPVTNERVEKLKAQYPNVLCTEQPQGLPPYRPTVPTIPLVNENLTVFRQMYRLSPAEKRELEITLQDNGHPQETVHSFSPTDRWANRENEQDIGRDAQAFCGSRPG